MNNRQKKIFEKIKNTCSNLNFRLDQDYYINTKDPIKLICFCGNKFTAKSRYLLAGCIKSCKCRSKLNEKIINDRLAHLKICIVGIYVNDKTKTKFQCFCGNLFDCRPRDLLNGKSFSCGDIHKHREQDFLKLISDKKLKTTDEYCGTNKKYTLCCIECGKKHRLKKQQILKHKCIKCRNLKHIKENEIIKNNKVLDLDNRRIKCECIDCKKQYSVLLQRLTQKQSHSCKYIGAKKFNTILQKYCDKNNIVKLNSFRTINDRVYLKCKCNKKFSYLARDLYRFIKNDIVFECKKCHLLVRGSLTSQKALELHSRITNFGVHNFKTKSKKCVDIAFSYKGKKIAIEYDEWFWHKSKKKRDIRKTKKLIKEGWLVVRILAYKDIPSKRVVFRTLDKMINDNKKYRLLKSKNWLGYQ